MRQSYNQYDVLLCLLMILMAAGQIGGALQLPRMALILILPFFIFSRVFVSSSDDFSVSRTFPAYRYEVFFFLVWWLHSLVSLFFAFDLSGAGKAFAYLSINFLGLFEILWLAARAIQPQRAILTGWMLMFLCTLPVALYELTTDAHLPMSVQSSDETIYGGEVNRLFASVTFGNLNAYNVVLCMTFSMMMIRTFSPIKKDKLIAYACAFVVTLLIVINGSRAASLCVGFVLFLFLCIMMRNKKQAFSLFAVFALIGGVMVYKYHDAFSLIIQRFQTQGFEDSYRMSILINGLKEWYLSGGWGIGINNFNTIMEQKYHLLITPPHNLWLEVGAQFGIFIFIGFLLLFMRVYQWSRKGAAFNKSAALIGIAALLPMSIIDSGYLPKTHTRFYIASLYILSHPAYNPSDNQQDSVC